MGHKGVGRGRQGGRGRGRGRGEGEDRQGLEGDKRAGPKQGARDA